MNVEELLAKAEEYLVKAMTDNPSNYVYERYMEAARQYVKMAEVLAGFETA